MKDIDGKHNEKVKSNCQATSPRVSRYIRMAEQASFSLAVRKGVVWGIPPVRPYRPVLCHDGVPKSLSVVSLQQPLLQGALQLALDGGSW